MFDHHPLSHILSHSLSCSLIQPLISLTGKDVYDTDCGSKQLCFIAFLPLLEESGKDGRNAYIDVLKESAAKYKQRPFGWVWSEATRQPQTEEALEVRSPALSHILFHDHNTSP